MKLRATTKLDDGFEYLFEHAANGRFVNHAVFLRVDGQGRVVKLRLNSARFGLAVWESEKGLVECRAWESDDELERLSYVSKHYQAPLMGAEKDAEYARGILDDCLAAARNRYLIRTLLDFREGEGRAVFEPEAFKRVESEVGPELRRPGGIARAVARRRHEKEERTRREQEARRMADLPHRTPRTGPAYIAPPPVLLLLLLGGYLLYSSLNPPTTDETYCCSPSNNHIRGVTVSEICKRGKETEVRLYLHADSQACARIEKTELTDARGRSYAPIRQAGIAHCDREGFTSYDAGHRFQWVFARIKDDVEFLRLSEVVNELKYNGKPPEFWKWSSLNLTACEFKLKSEPNPMQDVKD